MDAFGVDRGGVSKGVPKPPRFKFNITPVTSSTNPKIAGSSSPAAKRAKELWQSQQDKRGVRNAWAVGRHING